MKKWISKIETDDLLEAQLQKIMTAYGFKTKTNAVKIAINYMVATDDVIERSKK